MRRTPNSVDIDPSEINKNVVADAAIVGDLRETLADFLDVLEPEDHAPWLAYIDSMKGDAAVRDIQKLPDTGHLWRMSSTTSGVLPAATLSWSLTSVSTRCGRHSTTITKRRVL